MSPAVEYCSVCCSCLPWYNFVSKGFCGLDLRVKDWLSSFTVPYLYYYIYIYKIWLVAGNQLQLRNRRMILQITDDKSVCELIA